MSQLRAGSNRILSIYRTEACDFIERMMAFIKTNLSKYTVLKREAPIIDV
jgi:tRNA G10  N-methylase Trm11